MNNNVKRVVAGALACTIMLPTAAFANSNIINKSETVYVIKNDGEIRDKTVSVWLNSEENIRTKDKTDLRSIKNLKTDEEVNPENGVINWNEDKKDIYYQGKSEKDLPVDVNIKYFLDSKEMKSSELKGKSGHLKIEISAEIGRAHV